MKKIIALFVGVVMLAGLCGETVALSEGGSGSDAVDDGKFQRIVDFAKSVFGSSGIEGRLNALFGAEGGLTDEKVDKMLSSYELFNRQDGFTEVNQTWKNRFREEIRDNDTIADALVMLSLFETFEKQPIDRDTVDALLFALLLIDYYDDDDLSDVEETLDNIDAMLAVRKAEAGSGSGR